MCSEDSIRSSSKTKQRKKQQPLSPLYPCQGVTSSGRLSMLTVNTGLLCSLPWCRQGEKRKQCLVQDPAVGREPVKYEQMHHLVWVSEDVV